MPRAVFEANWRRAFRQTGDHDLQRDRAAICRECPRRERTCALWREPDDALKDHLARPEYRCPHEKW